MPDTPLRRALRRLVPTALLALAAVAAKAAPIVVAIGQPPLFTPLQLADLAGYFAIEGLAVQVLPCVNGRRCLKHLLDGEAQVATVADTPMVFALHAGQRFDIVATFSRSVRDNQLVARTDHGIRTPADLAGKRIGILRGTSAHYFTTAFLLVNGVPRDAVTLVPLDPLRGADPLLLGEVDAAGFYRPVWPQAVRQLDARGLVLPGLFSYTVTANLVAQPGLSQDVLLRLLRAVQRATTLLTEQPARAHALLAAHWKLDAKAAASEIDGYDFHLGLDQNLLTTLEAESRWAVREGLVDNPRVPDYLERIRIEPLRALDPRTITLVK